MSSSKSILRLVSAFAALAALALAVSCKGFFPPDQIQSITITPTTATVPLNGTFQLSAYGVDTTGNQLGNVTTQVSWSSSDPSTISVGATTGLLTGVSLGTSTTPVTISAAWVSRNDLRVSRVVVNGFIAIRASWKTVGAFSDEQREIATDAEVGVIRD